MLKVSCVLAGKEVPGLSFVVSHQGTFGSLKPLVERRIVNAVNREAGAGGLMMVSTLYHTGSQPMCPSFHFLKPCLFGQLPR